MCGQHKRIRYKSRTHLLEHVSEVEAENSDNMRDRGIINVSYLDPFDKEREGHHLANASHNTSMELG